MTTNFSPVKANLGSQIFQHLRDRIYRMELLPGSRLGVGEIADQLGVSRSPVRDAFHMLLTEGLIVPGPASGYRVIDFDRKYIDDVFEVRRVLELLAVRLCIANLDRDRVEQLRATWQELYCPTVNAPQSLEVHLSADAELHRAICDMSENAVLQDTLIKIIERAALIRRWVFTGGVTQDYLVTLAGEHLRVLDAILTCSVDAAIAEMDKHLESGQARARKRLDAA